MTFKTFMKRCIPLGCAAMLAASAHANLVTNGGFETGNFTGWNVTLAGSGSNLSVVNNFPHTGIFYARFGATSGLPDTISQSLATVAGASYAIDYWLRNSGSGPNQFDFNWDGGAVEQSLVNAAPFGYTQFSYSLVATSALTTISFASSHGPSFFRLDDVNVEFVSGPIAVPEPTSLALVGLAGLIVFSVRRRRQV